MVKSGLAEWVTSDELWVTCGGADGFHEAEEHTVVSACEDVVRSKG